VKQVLLKLASRCFYLAELTNQFYLLSSSDMDSAWLLSTSVALFALVWASFLRWCRWTD